MEEEGGFDVVESPSLGGGLRFSSTRWRGLQRSPSPKDGLRSLVGRRFFGWRSEVIGSTCFKDGVMNGDD